MNAPMPTVLHINNNPEIIGITRNALRRAGYKVVEAYTGYSGLQAIEEVRPDAVLLELDVTDMDGLDVVHALRSKPDTSSIPVLAITPRAQNVNRVVALQAAGIDNTLIKPFTTHELVESVRMVIAGR